MIGLLIAIVTAAAIIGGIKSIAKITSVLVPFMALLYILGCLTVIFFHVNEIPSAIGQIFTGAFSTEGVVGGELGAMIVGFQRAAYYNVAGVGDAVIAHSTVKTHRPATEGFVAALEPFVDTVVVCTMTALFIVVTGTWKSPDAASGISGVTLTSRSFESVVGWFPIVLTIAVLLFAFSTILSYSYYGMKGCGYLFGDSHKAEGIYKVVFLSFTIIGAAIAMAPVILFAANSGRTGLTCKAESSRTSRSPRTWHGTKWPCTVLQVHNAPSTQGSGPTRETETAGPTGTSLHTK